MMNARIIVSLVSIIAVASMMAAGTFAFFSDTATSNNNTFSTGNADLQIANDVEPGDPGIYANDISGVVVSGMVPGDTITKDFWLKNNSSGNFSMIATGDLTNLGGSNNGDLPNQLLIQFTCDTDNNGLGTGNSLTAEQSVNAWVSGESQTFGTIGPKQDPAVGATTQSDQDELLCRMTARLPENAENSLAGKDLSFDGTFNATQVVP